MKKFFSAAPIGQEGAIFIARIITGCFLIYHGWEVFDPVKMKEYAAWDQFKNSASPSFMPYLGKGAELVAGFMLAIGVLTRISCLIIIGTMGYISFFVGHGKVWYDDQHPFMFVLLAFLFFFTGPGALSADRALFGKK